MDAQPGLSAIGTLEARTERLDDTGIDYSAFHHEPLDTASLRCLRAMHDVEFHTICYLRDILVTPAHQDPAVTAFLTFWAYEEYWHGAAIGRVLAAHHEPSSAERIAPLRRGARLANRLRPLGMQAASAVGDSIVALQMAWGAVNERSTQAAYGRLAVRSGHPVLADLLQRIRQQEARHVAFYTQQAQARLARSRVARTVTRWTLRHVWSPVGSGILDAADVDFVLRHLFGDEHGRTQLARIDHSIERLPGLRGLGLMAGLAERLQLGPVPPEGVDVASAA